MATTDPIADMLTRIRNACSAKFEQVEIPASKLKVEIARVLKQEGYIRNYRVMSEDKRPVIRIQLKYAEDGSPAMKALRRISKPGVRRYVGKDKLPRVLSGLGIAVLSTPRGVMTSDQARRRGIAGEVLCYIW
jgi:small subunit ribosomal protein S8